jgi:hypothetical protein
MGGCLLAGGTPLFANTTEDAAAGSIQAIQQASDPSAAIAAYANGIATDRNNPRIYEAYISKMVELGLPEMAFHQAESLTGMESNNGLAWGVVAYVDARRGQMSEATSAVILAGQFAPDNPFVQRTAGELTAWYDLKADKSTLPDTTKDGLAKIRVTLNKRTAFTDAYTTATKAYQSPPPTTPTAPPAQSSANPSTVPQTQSYADQPQDYAGPPYPYDYASAYPPPYAYYPDYGPYYWGPGWISPAAWWWWPVGSFVGFSFFPCSSFIVFNHNHGHFHDGFHKGSFHDGFVAHRDGSFHGNQNGGKFFGSHPHPSFANRSIAANNRSVANFHGAGPPSVLGSTPRNAVNSRDGVATLGRSTSFGRNITSQTTGNRNFAGTTAGSRMSTPTTGSPTTRFGNASVARGQNAMGTATRTFGTPGVATRTWNGSSGVGSRAWNSSAFANRTWNTTAINNRAWAPARAPQSFSSRSFAAPQSQSFATMGGFRGGMGGAPAFRGGGMSGGSFHGGGMGGGGFHGGGGGIGGGHGGGGGGGHR